MGPDVPKDYLPDPLQDNTFWLVDANDPTKKALRPQWKLGWLQNKAGWSHELMARFRNHGWRGSNHMSADAVTNTKDQEVESALHTLFDTQRIAYENKTNLARAKAAAAKKSAAKYRGRKVTKLTYRQAVRPQLPEEFRGPEFDHFFQVALQSSDESEHEIETALDPDTEDETQAAPVTAAKKAKVGKKGTVAVPSADAGKKIDKWFSRPPTYRAPVVSFDTVPYTLLIASSQSACSSRRRA